MSSAYARTQPSRPRSIPIFWAQCAKILLIILQNGLHIHDLKKTILNVYVYFYISV